MSRQALIASRGRAVLAGAALCFFASGAAALAYEVVWTRLLTVVFGHTVYAVTTVLAAYMGGLAVGSLAAARWADRLKRPLRAYGLLEAAVALYCAATPLFLNAVDAWYPRLHGALGAGWGTGALQFLVASAVLLPPTTLMGATLPILSRAVVRAPGLAASDVATLYAMNTWGAVAGTASTGFVLLRAIGLRSTVGVAVVLNTAAAALAFALERLARRASSPAPAVADPMTSAQDRDPGRRAVAVALMSIGVSGAASMAYEIAWTRALSLAAGSSTYAFSAMLTTFLVGLALGALVVSRVLRRRPLGLAAFGFVEVAIGLLAVALLPAFGRLPEAVLFTLRTIGISHAAVVGTTFALSFLVMIGPTLLIGATFPLLVAASGRGLQRLGRDVGVVYGANTVGTIVGAALAGFLLVPRIGMQGTVTAAAAANVVAGLAVVAVAPGGVRRARLAAGCAAVAFVVIAAVVPHWDLKKMTSGAAVYAASFLRGGAWSWTEVQRERELLFYADGISTTVAVVRDPVSTALSVNGKTDASNGFDMATQVLSGHLGPLLQPSARRALVIGLASGVTVGAMAQHPLERIDVAELEPAMVQASRFFIRENRDALADPRVRVLAGDGRHILAGAERPYDLVVSEPSNPWIAGVASLFTREFYEEVQRHLTDRGVVVQWLGAYAMSTRDVKMVVRTFQEVFPHVSIWVASPNDFLLVATPRPLVVDLQAIERRAAESPAVRADLDTFRWRGDGLLFRFFLDGGDARRFAQDAPINTDDRPLLEFEAPLALFSDTAADNVAAMRSFRTVEWPEVVGIDAATLKSPSFRLRAAWASWYAGSLSEADHQLSRAGDATALGLGDRVERARLLFVLGHVEEAFAELGAILTLRPSDAIAARYLKAAAALREEDVARRLRSTALASEGQPAQVVLGRVLHELAMQRRDRDLSALAAEQYAAALQLYPASHDLLNNYGGILFQLGDLDGAVAAVQRAVELNPGKARMQYNLGLLLEKSRRHREAAAAYAEAARLEPAWPLPRQRLDAVRAAGGGGGDGQPAR